ncbi:MAG: glycosyltransferase, partial [Proteobacteria bacterium]|nr:glycosyltransferase [Pseudomonadota bacterium]
NLGLACCFMAWDKHTFPFPDGSFDTVVLNRPSMVTFSNGFMLKEAVRLCTPGGRIIFSIALKENKPFSRSSIEAKVQELGFRFVKWADKNEYHWHVGYAENAKSCDTPVNHDISNSFPEPLPLEPLNTSEKVSVIIPTYNRADFLPHCLESVLNQTYPNLEIIVVNDGSTDNTDDVVKPYLQHILYIKKENGGKASAVNFALQKVTGKYVWIFDDDDIALPRKLEMDVRRFQKNPDVGVMHSRGYIFDNSTGKIFSVYMGKALEPAETILRLLEDTYILNASMVVKKACYDRVGFYREDLIRSEDYEMWFRLARHFKMTHLDCGTVLIRIHSEFRGTEKEHFQINTEESHKYEKKIFSEIYENFPLQDFYPPLCENPVDPYLQAAALVERARIMSLHWLNNLAEADLYKVVDLVKANNIKIKTPFAERMINIWQHAVVNGNRDFSRSLLKCMKHVSACTENKLEVSTYFAKRYLWSFLNNLKLLRLKQSVQRLIISLYFIGIVSKQKLYAKVSGNGRS